MYLQVFSFSDMNTCLLISIERRTLVRYCLKMLELRKKLHNLLKHILFDRTILVINREFIHNRFFVDVWETASSSHPNVGVTSKIYIHNLFLLLVVDCSFPSILVYLGD